MRSAVLLGALLYLWATSGQYLFDEKGHALRWERPDPVVYYIGPGEFGVPRSEIEAAVDFAFRQYQNAVGPTLPSFIRGTGEPTRVTLRLMAAHDCRDLKKGKNVQDLLHRVILIVPDPNNACTPERPHMARAHLLAADGATGAGAGLVTLPPTQMAQARINGTLRRLILHEIGHILGLSHTMTHAGAELQNGAYRSLQAVPVMFPYVTITSTTLQPIDVAWLKYLYRKDRALPRGYSLLWGNLRDDQGARPTQGLLVVATERSSGRRFAALTGYPDHGDFHVPVESGGTYEVSVFSVPHENLLEPGAGGFGFPGFRGDSGIGPMIPKRGKVEPDYIEPFISMERDPSVQWTDANSNLRLTEIKIPSAARQVIQIRGRLTKAPTEH